MAIHACQQADTTTPPRRMQRDSATARPQRKGQSLSRVELYVAHASKQAVYELFTEWRLTFRHDAKNGTLAEGKKEVLGLHY